MTSSEKKVQSINGGAKTNKRCGNDKKIQQAGQ